MLKPSYSNLLEAGTDEAGRGCLAGPVTAAAVILPEGFYHQKLNDSKQVSKLDRHELRSVIEMKSVCFAVQHIDPETIDQINILNASILGMHLALENLAQEPQFILVDGNRFKPFRKTPYSCIVKGDSKFQNIAAASILAKTYRDHYMEKIHEEFPMYNWKKNKGYPTAEHREAIQKYGVSPYHRQSFRLIPEQLKLEF